MTDAATTPATPSADPVPTPFEQLGGVAGVRALVDRFYVIAERTRS